VQNQQLIPQEVLAVAKRKKMIPFQVLPVQQAMFSRHTKFFFQTKIIVYQLRIDTKQIAATLI